MAELVDALVSGTSVSNGVQVRVLFWAQLRKQIKTKALKINVLGAFSFTRKSKKHKKSQYKRDFTENKEFFQKLFSANRVTLSITTFKLIRIDSI